MGIMVLTPPRRKTQQRSLATVAVQSGGAPAPWFYLRNDDDLLPAYNGRLIMEHPKNWTYGVVQVHQSRLNPLLDALKKLRVEGLSAALGPIDVRSSRPPVKEDRVDRDKRRQSTEKQKSAKDSEKKEKKKKNLDRQSLEAQPSMAKRLKVGAASRDLGSSDPRPPTGAESAQPRPLAGESAPSLPKWVGAPHPQGQEGAPEPARSGVEADPITISDGSSGDGSSRDARPMDEEVEAFPTARRTPWPIGLHSVEEQRRKEEREREQEARQQPQEEQQLQPKGGEVGQPSAGPRIEELLEQDRHQEPQEPQEQQQQRGQQLEEPLEPPPHSPPQPVPPAQQEPENQEEDNVARSSEHGL
ncbi:PH domain-containing protein DDB_G0275795-like [Sorghum bicolor]|uniref:PH domain-containing protein DDB_G0275795-like n=1 Tax=Sorghum bicolor TaxID=4558 RepID=UPI000B424E3D|nr:PH domain-containing protein DDB_G0275795-like [Sorghum bicolor]|eukprot:XP_021317714.1 PH domain-containing protein DDB_G0275795-like [Sorghum bicolor]